MLSRFLTVREQIILVSLGLAIVAGALSLVWYNHNQPAQTAIEEITVPQQDVIVPPAQLTTGTIQTAPNPAPAPEPVQTPSPHPERSIIVAVQGAVEHPGSYTLLHDSRVDDLIKAAGGTLDHADLHDINLSARLLDGVTLSIPEKTIAEVDGKRIRMRGSDNHINLNPPQYRISSGYVPAPQFTQAATDGITLPPTTGTTVGPINLNTATQAQLETLPGIGRTYALRIIQHRKRSPFRSVDELLQVPGIAEKRFAAIAHLVTVQ